MTINRHLVSVSMLLAALWCGSAAASGFVTNSGVFSVSSPTTFSYVTNYWNYTTGYGLISSDVTVTGNAILRIGGKQSKEHGVYFATNADDDVTFTIGGSSGVYFTYRDSTSPKVWTNACVDPYGSTASTTTYMHSRFGHQGGAKDSSGRAKFVLNSKPNTNFGSNINPISLWLPYLHVESSAKAHDTGYVDVLEINNNNTMADVAYFCNHNTNHPMRIIFNGGMLRNNQNSVNRSSGKGQFLPDANTEIVLEGTNKNDIAIHKCYFAATDENARRRLNGGKGTLRIQGDCDIKLFDDGAQFPDEKSANRGVFVLDPECGPIEWNQTGDIIVAGSGWLVPYGDNMLPIGENSQTIRLQGNGILDPNNHVVSLRSLVSESASAMVTNALSHYDNIAVTNSVLVFGTNDTHGVFSAKCYDHVNIEKVGAGTLIISNATVDVNNTGTASVNIKEGTVIFIGTNKIGNEDMFSSSRCTIADGVTVVKNPTSWGVGKELVLGNGSYLKLGKDNQLPNGVTNQEIRLTGNAVLDLNGHNLKVPVLVAANTATVTNGTSTLSTLYFGEEDYADSRLSAKCFGNISIVKNGSGTMSIMDATVDADNTGNGSVTINSGSVVFYGTNKIGDETMQSSARCTFGEGVEKLDGVVVEVANGVTQISDETYTDGTLRLRVFKRGAGTLVLTNALNNFSGGACD